MHAPSEILQLLQLADVVNKLEPSCLDSRAGRSHCVAFLHLDNTLYTHSAPSSRGNALLLKERVALVRVRGNTVLQF